MLAAPDLEGALIDEGVPPEAAGTLAERLRPLAGSTPHRPDVPAGRWLGIAGAAGVPGPERPVLELIDTAFKASQDARRRTPPVTS